MKYAISNPVFGLDGVSGYTPCFWHGGWYIVARKTAYAVTASKGKRSSWTNRFIKKRKHCSRSHV